jgi:7,8-dihydropterin-6-yl-methyl-4-(beta-D-ribofuranosyl)aminobenzene 5'-phosphate synthase
LPPPGVSPDKQTADLIVDDAAHEPGVVFNIGERGLVVSGSCSHGGIVNTV